MLHSNTCNACHVFRFYTKIHTISIVINLNTIVLEWEQLRKIKGIINIHYWWLKKLPKHSVCVYCFASQCQSFVHARNVSSSRYTLANFGHWQIMKWAMLLPLTTGFHRQSTTWVRTTGRDLSEVLDGQREADRKTKCAVQFLLSTTGTCADMEVSLHFAEKIATTRARALHEFADHVSAQNLVGFSTCHFSEVPAWWDL